MDNETVKWFTDHSKLRVSVPKDMHRMKVIAEFIGSRPSIELVMIVAKKRDFGEWATIIGAVTGRSTMDILLITPDSLRNDVRRLGYVHSLIIDETLSGAASWLAVGIMSQRADRVIVINQPVHLVRHAIGDHANAEFLAARKCPPSWPVS